MPCCASTDNLALLEPVAVRFSSDVKGGGRGCAARQLVDGAYHYQRTGSASPTLRCHGRSRLLWRY